MHSSRISSLENCTPFHFTLTLFHIHSSTLEKWWVSIPLLWHDYTKNPIPIARLPTFQPTSSPELDALLDNLRQNIFIPASLFRGQRNLIYRKSKQHALLNPDEPVTITLSTGEPYTLRPIDRNTDEPNSRKSFHRALVMMNQPQDFDALPGLLEGFILAKRKVTDIMQEEMIRKCAQCGKGGIVLKCIQEVEKTGIKLDRVNVVRAAMLIPVFQAANGKWGKEGLNKACKSAESILNTLEDPHHVPSLLGYEDHDPRIHPDVVGVVLSMFATRAVRFQSSQDEDGKVEKYAQRMLSLWGNAELTPSIRANFHFDNYRLAQWVPAWQGMNMALRVLNSKSELGRRLQDRLQNDLQPLVERIRAELSAVPHPRDEERKDGRTWWGLKIHSIFAATLES